MRFADSLLALALAVVTAAQSQCKPQADAIATCALSCLASAGSQVGCTVTDEYRCRCSKQAAIESLAINCVIGACGVNDALAVRTSASALCSCAAIATNDPAHPTSTPAPGPTSSHIPPLATSGPPLVSFPSSYQPPITSKPAPTGCSGPHPCAEVGLRIPECASSCLASAGSAEGCGSTDFACKCSSSQNSAIASRAQGCVINACGINTALQVRESAAAVCSCVTASPVPTDCSTRLPVSSSAANSPSSSAVVQLPSASAVPSSPPCGSASSSPKPSSNITPSSTPSSPQISGIITCPTPGTVTKTTTVTVSRPASSCASTAPHGHGQCPKGIPGLVCIILDLIKKEDE